jgi:hypothetical protein
VLRVLLHTYLAEGCASYVYSMFSDQYNSYLAAKIHVFTVLPLFEYITAIDLVCKGLGKTNQSGLLRPNS